MPADPILDPRDVLDLLARTSASGGVRGRESEPGHHGADADIDEGLVHLTRLPSRRAEVVPLPDNLPPLLRQRLELAGVTDLWRHQRDALELARQGRHLVVATGTASGKSLCYQLQELEGLLADDKTACLYLAPTKALARDQLR